MSFTEQITLTDGTTPENFDQVSIGAGYTTRRNAGPDISSPKELKISTQGNSNNQQTAVILDDYQLASDDVTQERVRVLFKLDRPKVSSTFSTSEIKYRINQLVDFLSVEANIDKLLNGES